MVQYVLSIDLHLVRAAGFVVPHVYFDWPVQVAVAQRLDLHLHQRPVWVQIIVHYGGLPHDHPRAVFLTPGHHHEGIGLAKHPICVVELLRR
jgi:hypothetical protein